MTEICTHYGTDPPKAFTMVLTMESHKRLHRRDEEGWLGQKCMTFQILIQAQCILSLHSVLYILSLSD